MTDKFLNLFAFIASKINIKVVFFAMIFIGTIFYVPPKYVNYIPENLYHYAHIYLKYFFFFMVIVLTIPVFVKRKFDVPINKLVIILSLYVTLCLLSIVINIDENTREAMIEFGFFTYYFIVLLLMLYTIKNNDHKILIYALTGLVFYNSVASYSNIIWGFGEISAFFENRVYLGCLSDIVSTYLIILLFNEKSKVKKIFFSAGILLLFVNIILLVQRSVYLAYFFVITLVILGTKNRRIIIVGVLLCCIVGILFGTMMMKRVKREKMDVANMSDIGRFLSLRGGFNMWKTHPILGVGYGTSKWKIDEYETFPFKLDGITFPIHNFFIQQLAETGFVGFILCNTFNVVLLSALIRRFKGKKNLVEECPYELFYLIALCAYNINGMMHPINFREGYYWYLSAGAMILLRDNNDTNVDHL
ncbi:MAG: O-antigen ligase family protein [Chitinispirillales bacterium]|jgi:O-antigen ligase|nr:O-antigen ligase family protein [Chitinispirillales bacterium]